MSQNATHPARAGQAVRNLQGHIGITTDELEPTQEEK